MKLPYSLRLKVPHAEPDAYARAVAWLEAQDPDIAALEGAYGITYLNGKIYVSEVGFKNDEDRLMFALTFPELVWCQLEHLEMIPYMCPSQQIQIPIIILYRPKSINGWEKIK